VSKNGPALDVIFFDVDDTLYSTTAFAESARRNAVQGMIDAGLDVSLEEGVAELAEVVTEFSSNYSEHFARLLDRFGTEVRGGRNAAVLIAAGVVAYHRTKERNLEILADVKAALEALRTAGVRMGVISAGLRVKQAEKLVRLDALGYFEPGSIYFSDQVGVGKPNPKIYVRVCELVGVEPERAMYVGDRPDHDIAPARSIGMRTVHYTGAGGKYCAATCAADPHHRLDDMRELPRLLREHYGLG